MKTIKQKFEVTVTPKTDPEGEQAIAYVLGLLIGAYTSRFLVTELQHAAIMEIKNRVLFPVDNRTWEYKKAVEK